MLLEEFDYTLPPELIAQRPLDERDASRMLVLDRAAAQWQDRAFGEIAQLLRPGDLLVFNNTKVFPARLLGRRRGITSQHVGKNNPAQRGFLTGETELFLTRQESEDVWQGLVHPGHVPLPPYIQRRDEASDRTTYQTVYAKVRGAVAAPTAGLHFTERVLGQLSARGVETCEITLHVGLGTFQPVRVKQIEDHQMEAERYNISEAAATAINRALDQRRRVIAVGTTSVRTLETVASAHDGRVEPGGGDSRLFITPGFRFQVISGLLTNFHVPQSTLLMLVSAFAGKEFTLTAYRHAVESRYRFYSYGDCMLIS
jgi:S-adenosylmethionine:tRNA ribosyltransferase-isomerase